MTFKSTIEALSEVSIDSSDACPAAGFHLMSEAELDGVTGGRIPNAEGVDPVGRSGIDELAPPLVHGF
jgi:hypothetical protein